MTDHHRHPSKLELPNPWPILVRLFGWSLIALLAVFMILFLLALLGL